MTISPIHPSKPHHQHHADIGDATMDISRNYCFEPSTDLCLFSINGSDVPIPLKNSS